jgi:hypothetical protein
LKTYFITIKNIVSEEEMKIIGESPSFSIIFIVFGVLAAGVAVF